MKLGRYVVDHADSAGGSEKEQDCVTGYRAGQERSDSLFPSWLVTKWMVRVSVYEIDG